jgi:phage terminase large subunit
VPAWVPGAERCANLRAALYWRLRWRLENTWRRMVCGEVQIPAEQCIQLPRQAELRKQLLSLRLRERPDGAILVESKADMARRGVESPDMADALMYSEAAALLGQVSRQTVAPRPALSARRF